MARSTFVTTVACARSRDRISKRRGKFRTLVQILHLDASGPIPRSQRHASATRMVCENLGTERMCPKARAPLAQHRSGTPPRGRIRQSLGFRPCAAPPGLGE